MIRRATSKDIDNIDECNRAVLPENYEKDLYIQLFDFDGLSSFVVEDNEKIVGYIITYIQKDNKNNLIGHVMSLALLKDYRQKGFGKKLMEIAEEDLIKRYKIKYMTLHVRKNNKPANILYSKLCYSRIKKVKNYYSKSVCGLGTHPGNKAPQFGVGSKDAYLMKKNL